MIVLVTGAAGFLGSHIVSELLHSGHTVIGLDLDRYKLLYSPIHSVTADITQSLNEDLGECDCVIHLAAIASPRVCDADPSAAFNVNVNGTYNILKFALQHKVKKVLFASTGHVYGISPKYLPTDERHPLWLHDVYTCTKILGEQLCQRFYDNHGLNYTILRLFNVYGPGQKVGYFIPDMIRKAREGHIELRGRSVTKDFVFVKDVVSAFMKSLETEYVGALNIGSGRETTLEYVAHYIAQKLGAKLTFAEDQPPPTQMLCDITRAKTILDWQPNVSLEEGLDATINAQ